MLRPFRPLHEYPQQKIASRDENEKFVRFHNDRFLTEKRKSGKCWVPVMNLALAFVIHGWTSTGRIMLSITQEPSLLRKLNTIEV